MKNEKFNFKKVLLAMIYSLLMIGSIITLTYGLVSYFTGYYDKNNIDQQQKDIVYYFIKEDSFWKLVDKNIYDESLKKTKIECNTKKCTYIAPSSIENGYVLIKDDTTYLYNLDKNKIILNNIDYASEDQDDNFSKLIIDDNYLIVDAYPIAIYDIKTGIKLLRDVIINSITYQELIYDKYIAITNDSDYIDVYDLEKEIKLSLGKDIEHVDYYHNYYSNVPIALEGDKYLIIDKNNQVMVYDLNLNKYTYFMNYINESDESFKYIDVLSGGIGGICNLSKTNFANLALVSKCRDNCKYQIINYRLGINITDEYDSIKCMENGYCILSNKDSYDKIYDVNNNEYYYENTYHNIYDIVGNNDYLLVENDNKIYLANMITEETIVIIDDLSKEKDKIKEEKQDDYSGYFAFASNNEDGTKGSVIIQFYRNTCSNEENEFSKRVCISYSYDFITNKVSSNTNSNSCHCSYCD